jgi:hypothetical protein
MIRISGKEYDGYIAENQDESLTVILHTWEGFDDVCTAMTDVKSIESVTNGESTVYNVTAPVSARVVGLNLYSIVFTTKLAPTEELTRKVEEQAEIISQQADTIQELSDTIDQLLIDSLEG